MTRSPVLESLPVAAAPMAGGPTTLALAAAVAGEGAFPFLPGGYRDVADLAADVADLRRRVTAFGVNLFVPMPRRPPDEGALRAYAARLRPEAEHHGVDVPSVGIGAHDDGWPEKLALLREDPVPVVSFTFGLPDTRDVTTLHRAGTRVLVTVTTPDEARAAQEIGVDGLVVQGSAAGGHSAAFDPEQLPRPLPTDELVRAVRAATGLPVVAGGGVHGPESVKRLLRAGAETVAVGTLLLRTEESGASPTHKAALADPRFTGTTLTRAFTGRPARSLRNGFIDRHERHAPSGYPEVHLLTREIRRAAARAGDPDRLHLWAGTGYRSAPTGPAAGVVRQLVASL